MRKHLETVLYCTKFSFFCLQVEIFITMFIVPPSGKFENLLLLSLVNLKISSNQLFSSEIA